MSDYSEILLHLSEIKADVKVNTAIIQEIKKDMTVVKDRSLRHDSDILSLLHSRKTAKTVVAALWSVIIASITSIVAYFSDII